MVKTHKILIAIIGLLAIFSSALADNNIKMLVKFDVPNPKLLTNASIGNKNFKIACTGLTTSKYPKGYSITGSLLANNGLEIGVNGPFSDDKRKSCTIYDSSTKNTNAVYFVVENLPISFTYNNESHTCYLNQGIGTSWNNATRDNDKLQAQNTGTTLSCNGNYSTDTYKINPGKDLGTYDKGNITIAVGSGKLSTASTSNIKMLVKFDVPDSNLLTNIHIGNESQSYKMSCNGLATSIYPKGYQITGSVLSDDGLEIGVTGPFPQDQRESCTIYDNKTTNTNKVYFSVESLPIFFTYNNQPHSCYINQNIGTSWNNPTRDNDKLQGQNTNISVSCNGNFPTDTYEIHHGKDQGIYNKGNITIKIINPTKSGIGFQVNYATPSSKWVMSDVTVDSTMACGMDNGFYVTGTTFNGQYNYSDGMINIEGPFNKKQMDCFIYDRALGGNTFLYFILNNIVVNMDIVNTEIKSSNDKKQHHTCNINQDIGTTYFDNTSLIHRNCDVGPYYDELRSTEPGTIFPCNGNVNGDTYKIVNGGMYSFADGKNCSYSAGHIEINLVVESVSNK